MTKLFLWKQLVELFLEKETFPNENLENWRQLLYIHYLQHWKLFRLFHNEKENC
jgi:hypothetical protein